MRILNHRLCGDDKKALDFRRSPNQSSGTITPEYLVMHYTAGGSASSSINWLLNKQAKASAHLVISREGAITQLVAFNRKAWHAGQSQWEGRRYVNGFSIGVELANYGRLSGEPGRWRTTWGKRIDDDDVVVLPHPYDGKECGWQPYTEEQLTAAAEVALLLVDRYELKGIIGHEDISPGRKFDPGPAFPMESFRSRVLGREKEEPEIFETTANLNIRTGPGTRHEKLPESPLPEGTKMELLSRSGVWCEVDVLDVVRGEMDISGWVHSRYIKIV